MTEKESATVEIVEPDEKALAPRPVSVAAIAAAEQAKALIQARVMLAVQRPRDIDDVRRRLLNECKRPRFAEAARYRKPMGGGAVQGWSIRFAEAAVRIMGNIDCRASTIAEDDDKAVLRFDALDLETNASFGGELSIAKVIERRKLRKGEQAISTRTNSRGEPTFKVKADEDEMLTKTANAISKGIRTYALRLVPADILEECLDAIHTASAKTDPTIERKRIVDAYAALGVAAADVKKICGAKDLELLTAAQLTHLREVYAAIKDGEISVEDVIGEKEEKTQSLKDKVKAGAEGATKAT